MKKLVFFALLFLETTSLVTVSATTLGDLAASMQPGTWAELQTTGLTYSLIDDGDGHNILQYSDDAEWDPTTKRFLYMGTGHMQPGKFIAYSDSSNSWSLLEGLSGRIGIHAYDHNALNPSTGIFYNRQSGYGYRVVNQIQNGVWTRLPDLPGGSEVAGALEFFPEMNGLIYVTNYGGGTVYYYNLSTNSWSTLTSSLTFGPYHNFAEYSPVHKVMIFGGGNDNRDVYRLSSSGVITKMSNAPIPLGIWHHSVVTVDPVSGNFLILGSDRAFRSCNPITDSWTTLGGNVPVWNLDPYSCDGGSIGCIVATPVSTYGVNMFLIWNSGNPKAYLYKHSGTPSLPDTQPPTTPTNLQATPISSSQINLAWTASTDNVGVTGYRIYRCQGAGCTPSSQADTSPTNSYSNTGLTASTAYTYSVAAYDAAGNPSGQSSPTSATTPAAPPPSSATILYGFDSGGPLICTGTSPNIVCDDTGDSKWDGFNWNTDAFYQDSDASFRINWAAYDPTHGPDYGWIEIDNTKGAKGTTGSLKVRVTGSATNGGLIEKKSDELNYPSRVGTGIGGNMYLDFYTTGKHRPEFQGKKRMSAYIWIPNNWMLPQSYGGPADDNMHIGTYVCSQADDPCIDRTGCSPWSYGEPCDGSIGHFYHYFSFGQWGGGGWVHINLDQNPQYKRYGGDSDYNPTQRMFGEDYLPSLNRFYFDVTRGTDMQIPTPFELWIDELEALPASYFAEQDQNENTISSAAVGYYPDNDGHWEISWNANVGEFGTYEVKYSFTEFTNSNFNTNGQHINPLKNAAAGGNGLVGKQHTDTWSFAGYATYFNLPSEYEQPGTIVHFAIKDVSQQGQHGTAEIGWQIDQRTSSDTRIYAVDYHVPGNSLCVHKSEIPPCDGSVCMNELNAFISRWQVNNMDVNLRELMEAIGLWKQGGC